MHVAFTRRLLTRVAQVTSAIAFVVMIGCGDDPRSDAPPGAAGSYGAAGAGAGTAGNCGVCDAGGGTGGDGTGGTGDGGGTGGDGTGGTGDGGSMGGSIGGAGGSIGGMAGSGRGAGGSIGGTVASGVGGAAGSVTLQPWPTSDAVVMVDNLNQFPQNLSDLVDEPGTSVGTVLWGIQNNPSILYRLIWNGTTWNGVTEDNWASGKTIRYPGGTGHPDSEGLTRAEWSSPAIYVSAERDNDNNNVSRMSLLRYDTSVTGTTELVATHEWNLTSEFPVSPANLSLESIAWIPDSFLVANAFYDDSANAAYDPSRYPNHGTGLFLIGLESNGMIYGYALDHVAGTVQRVSTFASGQSLIMSLYFDRDVGNLWVYCDNSCANRAAVLRMAGGRFVVQYLYDHPATLPNSNMEGITVAPESDCAQGKKSFFWADDDDYGGHALYRGTIPCGLLP